MSDLPTTEQSPNAQQDETPPNQDEHTTSNWNDSIYILSFSPTDTKQLQQGSISISTTTSDPLDNHSFC